MARSHAKVKCSIWDDDVWLSLDSVAKIVYVMLLSQPRLSLVGALDYTPKRWVKWFPDLTETELDDAVRRLEHVGWVVVDEDTDELLIRTFVQHDGLPAQNKNLRSGLWGAWRSLTSRVLRKVAADHMTAEQLGWEEADPAAVQMSRSERLKPQPRPRLEPPLAFDLPPTTCNPLPPPTAAAGPVHNSGPERVEDESEQGGLVSRTVRAVAHRELAAKKARGERIFSDSGFVSWWLQENGDGCAVRVLEILRDFDGLSDSQLADLACSHQAPAWAKQYRRDNHLRVVESEPA